MEQHMQSEKVDGADTQFVEVPSPEQLALLKRLVTDPTLVSDGTLRMTIANELGWRIDGIYFTDAHRPWGHAYRERALADRVDDLEEQVSAIRAHLVL